MDDNKLHISTPNPSNFNINIFKYKNIAIGKSVNKLPEPLKTIANTILHPPSPQDIINDFLTKMPSPQPAIEKQPLTIPQNSAQMIPVGGSALNGTPLFSNLEIQGAKWTAFDGTINGFQSLVFDTVLISCQQNKNIVVTEIQGSDDGAVMEYSGLNNYNITIDIIITGSKQHNGLYPSEAMAEVIKMLTCPNSLKVASWYLQQLSIYEIVVQTYDVSQQPGGISQQIVTIQAMSNKTTTLIIQQ